LKWDVMFTRLCEKYPRFGISLKLLLTTGLIPAGLLAFVLNAIMAKK